MPKRSAWAGYTVSGSGSLARGRSIIRVLTAVYGMSIAGEAGVRHVMRSLLADFDILMNCAGVNRIEDITANHLSESW